MEQQLEFQLKLVAVMWKLSQKHLDVLAFVAQSKSDADIAQALGMPEDLVQRYVASIQEKSGTSTRGELIAQVWRASQTLLPGGTFPAS